MAEKMSAMRRQSMELNGGIRIIKEAPKDAEEKGEKDEEQQSK